MKNKIAAAAVIITNNNKILLGLSTRNNTWNLPGGKHQRNESSIQCAIRETKEECNINLPNNLILIGIHEDNNTLCLIYKIEINDQIPKPNEPDKHKEWIWHDLNNLPNNINHNSNNAIKLLKG